MPYRLLLPIISAMVVFSLVFPAWITGQSAPEEPKEAEKTEEVPYRDWIVKWVDKPLASTSDYTVLETEPDLKVAKIRIPPDREEEVVERLHNDPNIEYVERNVAYTIHQISFNDPDFGEQGYLDQTRIREAWNLVTPNPDLTVAVIDTGVDLDHPDLKENLIKGYNLINEKQSPQDDNGHGTMVAGVLGASGNNKTGIVGVLWKSRIMPIKAMDNTGQGEAYDIARAIRLAVDQGADIILLSLGDPIYSSLMEESVQYAENKGVLVVSATGNSGGEVHYPAVYPTVLAVGAVDGADRVPSFSNYGQEVDVVAPGRNIYTTKLGGGYGTATGTSLAAPQVAGLAGLILSNYPWLTPAEVRNLIRMSAKDVGEAGWDRKAGYGRIDAVKALSMALVSDGYEPNGSPAQAKWLPLGKRIEASFSTGTDADWFKIDVPYSGKIRFDLLNLPATSGATVKATLFNAQVAPLRTFTGLKNGKFEANVPKGTIYLKLELEKRPGTVRDLQYSLQSAFFVYADSFEPNDSSAAARSVSLDRESIKGTIHQNKDEDWFKFTIPQNGRFTVRVTTDSLRLDPVITVIKPNKQQVRIDNGNWSNKQVESASFDVTAGELRIGIKNFYETAVNTEYTLSWTYRPVLVDMHEPNNTSSQAKPLKLGTPVYGMIGTVTDFDWFKFTVNAPGLYRIQGSNFPPGAGVNVFLYDGKLGRLAKIDVPSQQTSFTYQRWLEKGTYYLRLDAARTITDRLYRLMVSNVEAVYHDIGKSWARQSINHLAALGIVSGYENQTFKPDKPITRAEFVTLLMKTLKLPEGSKSERSPFKDLNASHWAYGQILGAYKKGLISGYEDRSFRPDAPVTRAEMAVLLHRALSVKPTAESRKISPSPWTAFRKFTDVPYRHWAAGSIGYLVNLGAVRGYEDGTFRPTRPTSRAETVVLIEKIWFS